MRQNSYLEDLTLLSEGEVIPANEKWQGSPGTKIGINEPQQPSRPLWNYAKVGCMLSVSFLFH